MRVMGPTVSILIYDILTESDVHVISDGTTIYWIIARIPKSINESH